MTRSLYLYTTMGCHLCEQAEQLLQPVLMHANRLRQESGLVPFLLQPVDIADEPALVERFGVRIPVLCIQGGAVELGWPFDQGDIFMLLSECSR
jgi:hypothetical protein